MVFMHSYLILIIFKQIFLTYSGYSNERVTPQTPENSTRAISLKNSRKKQVFTSRLRIGYETYAHLYTQIRTTTLHLKYLVKYFLSECRDWALIRQSFFNANNMIDLFENVDIDAILSFLREIKLYIYIYVYIYLVKTQDKIKKINELEQL